MTTPKASLDRRKALGLLGGAGMAACATSPSAASFRGAPASTQFQHGVASGDPDASSVVIWTRVTSSEVEVPVRWECARDAAFTQILQAGSVYATADRDHTVKVLVQGLAPNQTVFFRFHAGGVASPTGRSRTLPVGPVARLGIALVSCSNYAFGHFNAYAAIAEDPAIDLVLHTGDYIYEYGADEWGKDTAHVLGRVHQPAHETVSLADYRQRHAQYKSDAGAQAMFAAHPFIACWDDHEVTNNPWMGGAQNHQPATEGDWLTRRHAALQAYYEWLPIRDPGMPGGSTTPEAFWRTYVFGDLATLVTLESRHTGRDQQVEYRAHFDQIKTRADRDRFMAEVIGDPARRMLSPAMERSLDGALRASSAAGQPWRILGNASPIARMQVPDLLGAGIDPARRQGYDPMAAPSPDLMWTARWTLPFYTDTWDGYPAARERLYDLCRAAGVTDLLVLTGDSHSFWMNQLADAAGRPMGLELGTAGVTSPGDFDESGWDPETSARLDEIFAAQLDEVVWTNNRHQGYVRVVLTPGAGRADFVAVGTVLRPETRTRVIRSTGMVRNGVTLSYVET